MTAFADITAELERQAIELPSWAFGNSGHAVQGVRPAGRASRPVREDRRRRRRCTGSPGSAPSVALHIPWDRVDDYDKLAGARRGPRRPARHHQHQHVPGRRLQARQPRPRRRAGAGQGDRPHARVRRHHGRHRQPRPQDLAARRHSTTRARTTCATARTASPTRWPQVYARLGDDQRLVLEYKFFEPAFYATDVPDWGTSYVQCVALGRAGRGLPRHRAPRARHEHRVHRHAAAAPRPARRLRLQLPLLRRRRPDRRRRRPVPAVPDHVRGRPRRRLRRRQRRRASCSTSATTSRRRSPARSARCSTCRR